MENEFDIEQVIDRVLQESREDLENQAKVSRLITEIDRDEGDDVGMYVEA